MDLQAEIKASVRDIKDFPKEGIVFKDITPILKDPQLSRKLVDQLAAMVSELSIDVVAGIESRGFLFGMPLATALNIPFVPIRKKGKLPYETISHQYELEYGHATIEIHKDAIEPKQNVLIHDDLLATGGTAAAAAELIKKLEGNVVGYNFIINLSFLNGMEKIKPYSENIFNLVAY